MKRLLLLLVPVFLLAEDPPKPAQAPQIIASEIKERYEQIVREVVLLEFQLCNGASLLRKDCVVNWQLGYVGPKPPESPKAPPVKSVEAPKTPASK